MSNLERGNFDKRGRTLQFRGNGFRLPLYSAPKIQWNCIFGGFVKLHENSHNELLNDFLCKLFPLHFLSKCQKWLYDSITCVSTFIRNKHRTSQVNLCWDMTISRQDLEFFDRHFSRLYDESMIGLLLLGSK